MAYITMYTEKAHRNSHLNDNFLNISNKNLRQKSELNGHE